MTNSAQPFAKQFTQMWLKQDVSVWPRVPLFRPTVNSIKKNCKSVPYVNKIKMYVFHTILWHELSNSWINTAWHFWGWTRVNGLFSVLGLICRSWIEQLQNAVPKRGKKWETDLLLREVGEWCCNTAKRNRGAVWTRVKCGHGVLFYLIIQMEEFSTKINW